MRGSSSWHCCYTLEGLEAYRQYSQAGDQRIWQQLSQQDKAVEPLIGELERLVRDHQFRLGQPGRAG